MLTTAVFTLLVVTSRLKQAEVLTWKCQEILNNDFILKDVSHIRFGGNV